MYYDEKILTMEIDELKKGAIPIDIYPDNETLFREIARTVAGEIVRKNDAGKRSLFIMPLGPSGQYKYLADMINSQEISLRNVVFINMDEYMVDEQTLIGENHPLSFRKTMNEEFYNKINRELIMPPDQRIFPDLFNKEHIRKIILENGGVDLCIGGIGINGHIAFNEPPQDEMSREEFENLSVRVIKIAPETVIVNSLNEFGGAYEFMPRYAITLGFKEILSARKVRLYCFRIWQKMVVRKAAFYPQSVEFPVTLLQGKDTRIGIPASLSE